MNKSEFLKTGLRICGTEEAEFEKRLRAMDEATVSLRGNLKDFSVWHIVKLPEHKDGFSDKLEIMSFEEIRMPGSISGKEVHTEQWISRPSDGGVLLDVMKNSAMILYNPQTEDTYFVSNTALKTLCQRLGLGARGMEEDSWARSAYFAWKMSRDIPFTGIVRTYGKINCIFAFLSEDFPRGDLRDLCRLYDNAAYEAWGDMCDRRMECRRWEISQKEISIVLELRKDGEELNNAYGLDWGFSPCVQLQTSDIGEASLTCRNGWIRGDGEILFETEMKIKHRGFVDTASVTNRLTKMMLGDRRGVLERLRELKKIHLTSMELDLNEKRDRNQNYNAVSECLNQMIDSLKGSVIKVSGTELRMKDALGVKRWRELKETADRGLIRDDKRYTAYDITVILLNLLIEVRSRAEKEGLSKDTLERLCKASMGFWRLLEFDWSRWEKI